MISVIITAYKEPSTIGKAIESIIKNDLKNFEIIVTAPDKETLDVARFYSKKNKNVKLIQDSQEGKPAALNLAVSKAKGDILIFTDGDVYVAEDSLKPLIELLKNKEIGAVSGNPISINSGGNKMGYWAFILTKVANDWRKESLRNNERFFCSGYLFAIRKELFPYLPKELLSEDGFISLNVYGKGYKIAYSENSNVYVKYPANFNDWIKQKKRSAGGYNQIKKITGSEMRSFKKESKGFSYFIKYIKNIREFIWTAELFIARIYLWYVIYRDINIKNKSHKEIWERVESTK